MYLVVVVPVLSQIFQTRNSRVICVTKHVYGVKDRYAVTIVKGGIMLTVWE